MTAHGLREAARGGDEDAFRRPIEPHRRELHALGGAPEVGGGLDRLGEGGERLLPRPIDTAFVRQPDGWRLTIVTS